MTIQSDIRIEPAGDSALTLYFPNVPRTQAHVAVASALRSLAELNLDGVLDLIPGRTSLTILYDPLCLSRAQLALHLDPAILADKDESRGNAIEVPVLYDETTGPDLRDVADRCGLSVVDVISMHTSTEYMVYFLGFQPGFPYMGELLAAIQVPRRDQPRVSVPAGSVAIADDLTCIYPHSSPGGWNVIGRTPLSLFNLEREPFCLLSPFDRVRFVAIDRDQFDAYEATG